MAGLLEQYKYVEAAKAFEFVVEAAPDWTAAWFNLGLAYFNMLEKPGVQSYLELAQAAFETVLQSDQSPSWSRIFLGFLEKFIEQMDVRLL